MLVNIIDCPKLFTAGLSIVPGPIGIAAPSPATRVMASIIVCTLIGTTANTMLSHHLIFHRR